MLFNSRIFLAFFLAVYPLYLLCHRSRHGQNLLLLAASYFFYASWDWRFLLLLGSQTVVDYVGASYLEKANEPRTRRLILSGLVAGNLTVLGFFKYFNFFADSTVRMVSFLGLHLDAVTLNIILPVGISFYTFHELSYLIDVYRGRVEASRSLIDYALFVAFFPLLVAGPIARANHLLPQIGSSRRVRSDRVNIGLFLILWGFYKKVVVADNVAPIADRIFNNYQDYQGLDLVIGVLAFTVQIYGDFSGYSDIARGIASLLGFDISLNFRLPYFAENPSDFWRRWHISLSSWLRDYLYVPLGGSRGGAFRTYRNLAITMLLGGLWHGAAWNFVLWGIFHGGLLIGYRLREDRVGSRATASQGHSPVGKLVRMTMMFSLTMVGWVLFRSTSAIQIIHMLTQWSLRPSPVSWTLSGDLLFYSLPLAAVQVAQHRTSDLLVLCKLPLAWRPLVYAALLVAIVVLGARQGTEFIYFQF